MSDAARSHRDDPRFEPQPGAHGRDPAGRAVEPDPLAELARLVGQDDPFRSMFRQPTAEASVQTWAGHAPHGADSRRPTHVHGAEFDDGHAHDGAYDHAYDGGYDHDGAAVHGDVEHGYDVESARYYAAERQAHPDEVGPADGHLAPDYPVGGVLPDDWARGEQPAADGRGAAAVPSSSARRPLAVLAAVLVLTGGGLGASFLAKDRSPAGVAGASAGGAAPTILAAHGPTKVKLDDASTTAPEDQDAALLNKNGALSSGPVRIVSSQEQPADLAQLPKADLAEGARPTPAAPASPFPEPKRVKTFLVHPDGRVLSADGAAPAAADAAPATPKAAAQGGGTTPRPAASSPAAVAPATPAAPPTIASLSADPTSSTSAAPAPAADAGKPSRQGPAPGPRTASAKPGDVADAPNAAAGGYGVQLASFPVEADADAAFAKLKKKYPTLLGSYTATVHRAETGDKPLFRVRVGGMSQDEANTLCSQLMIAGGKCVVLRR